MHGKLTAIKVKLSDRKTNKNTSCMAVFTRKHLVSLLVQSLQQCQSNITLYHGYILQCAQSRKILVLLTAGRPWVGSSAIQSPFPTKITRYSNAILAGDFHWRKCETLQLLFQTMEANITAITVTTVSWFSPLKIIKYYSSKQDLNRRWCHQFPGRI